MYIKEIYDDTEKQCITRCIIENLTDWFAIPLAREKYIQNSAGKHYFCAYVKDKPVGFLYLKQTGKDTLELEIMGVLKKYHRNGIGKALFENAKALARENGYSFIQVKTVQMGKYKHYDNTNKFYLSLGFKELEVFPTLWDKDNPCQVYVISLTE